jgi:hypothetical protein
VGLFEEMAKFVRLSKYENSMYSVLIGSYMDESFDARPKGVYAVGGILGRGAAIFELERRWEKLRKRPDIDIEYFKASECERGKGQFAKFCAIPEKPTPKEKKKLDSMSHEFLDLIADVAPFDDRKYLCIHAVGVIQKDFYEVIKDPKAKAILGPSPFRLAYDFALIQCAWTMKQLGKEFGVSFVCDADQEHASVVGPDFIKLQESNPKAAEYMLTFSTLDEKKCEPLQAADAAVYEVRRALNISLKQWTGPLRKQFSALSDARVMFLISHATKEQLLQIVSTHKPGEPFRLDALMEMKPPDENIRF